MTAAGQQPLIWALDLARVTGLAVGRVGQTPTAETITLAPDGATSDVLFLGCLHWFRMLLTKATPDVLAIEALLPPIARRGTTSTGAQHRLAGMHGIVRALARDRGIAEIINADVLDIRRHFIGRSDLRRNEAKRRVAQTCKMLGWQAADSNCADALALWSYAAGLINPVTALAVTPLFGAAERARQSKQRTWDDVAREREAKRG